MKAYGWTLAAMALAAATAAQGAQPQLGARTAPKLTVDGLAFKDLDRNGKLDPYEDWRLTPAARADDLIGRMTLEEKAGVMMHGTLPAPGNTFGSGAAYDLAGAGKLISENHVSSFITRLSGSGAAIAEENNKVQALAEASRLGVPATISTDPRNHFQHTAGAGVDSSGFSQWPESLGFAAVGDDALMRRFGEVARAEYRAAGIHVALSPQADLATEPRWPRITGTFGEDADLAGRMVRAYVAGFQAGETGLTKDSGRGGEALGRLRRGQGWLGQPQSLRPLRDLPGRELRLSRQAVRGRVRGQGGRDHADLFDSRRPQHRRQTRGAGGGGLQQVPADRPAARQVRLHRGHRLGLGDHQRLPGRLPRRVEAWPAAGDRHALGRRRPD
jgi:hypothetical protein